MSRAAPIRGQAVSRRAFNQVAAAGAVSLATSPGLAAMAAPPRGHTEACILIWLGGGMCHVDTLDPKKVGDPQTSKPGSAYESIPTAIPGVRVCNRLERVSRILDRGVLLRTLNHPLKVDHANSTNLVKTGRLTSGTIVYPSLGALISHQRGKRADDVPSYFVMGYPNVTRGPGFLGSKHGYLYLTDTEKGPIGLTPPGHDASRRVRRLDLLKRARDKAIRRAANDDTTRQYDAAIAAAQATMKGPVARLWRDNPATLGELRDYGSDFGRRCLLARQLVEAGVRFVEVAYDLNFKNGTGWDTHRHGQKNQHLLIDDLDESLSALVKDLETRRRLDETLIVVATEFGRPPDFDGQGGRGHQSAAFSGALFGGGLNAGQVVGQTDDFGRTIVERPISIPDFLATILATMGVDPAHELFDGDRPIPITDHGIPLKELFA